MLPDLQESTIDQLASHPKSRRLTLRPYVTRVPLPSSDSHIAWDYHTAAKSESRLETFRQHIAPLPSSARSTFPRSSAGPSLSTLQKHERKTIRHARNHAHTASSFSEFDTVSLEVEPRPLPDWIWNMTGQEERPQKEAEAVIRIEAAHPFSFDVDHTATDEEETDEPMDWPAHIALPQSLAQVHLVQEQGPVTGAPGHAATPPRRTRSLFLSHLASAGTASLKKSSSPPFFVPVDPPHAHPPAATDMQRPVQAKQQHDPQQVPRTTAEQGEVEAAHLLAFEPAMSAFWKGTKPKHSVAFAFDPPREQVSRG